MKRALITGLTGQDGSYLAELLLELFPGAFSASERLLLDRAARESLKRNTYGYSTMAADSDSQSSPAASAMRSVGTRLVIEWAMKSGRCWSPRSRSSSSSR